MEWGGAAGLILPSKKSSLRLARTGIILRRRNGFGAERGDPELLGAESNRFLFQKYFRRTSTAKRQYDHL